MTTIETGSAADDNRAEARDLALRLIRKGFDDRDTVRDHLGDYFEDEEDGPTPDELDAIVSEAWTARVTEQATWTDEGDYARLAAAFDALAAAGVVARMNFTCCQTCGHAEIDDERTTDGAPEWGYAFFHQQDADSIVEDEHVYLAYGTFGPVDGLDPELRAAADAGDDAARQQVMQLSSVAVGRTIADAVRTAGLEVNWDGTSSQRIGITITDWRKRLPA